MPIEPPGGKGPKIPGADPSRPEQADAVRGPEQKQRADFSQAIDRAEPKTPTEATSGPAGIDQVRQIARALRSGEIATRDQALDRACEAMIATRLSSVPRAALDRATSEVARLAREDPFLRARIGKLLDRLAEEA